MTLPIGVNARAMVVAWEQIAFWEGYMNAAEAGVAIGLSTDSWECVAKRLARLWIKLQRAAVQVERPHVPQHVDRMALTELMAA